MFMNNYSLDSIEEIMETPFEPFHILNTHEFVR